MKLGRDKLLLYAVTDRAWTGEKTLEQQIEEALEAGATMIQLREKHLSDEEFLEEAKKVKAITERFGVPLIINDNVEVAIRSGADGVHVGQSDMEAGNVRALIGEDKILGVTAKTVEQAKLAEAADELEGRIAKETLPVTKIKLEVKPQAVKTAEPASEAKTEAAAGTTKKKLKL